MAESELKVQHTKNLYEYSEVLSLVQKGVRRYEVDLCMFFMYDLVKSGFSRVLWHRMFVMAVEDIIFGNPAMTAILLRLFAEYEQSENEQVTIIAYNYLLQHTCIRIASTASICTWTCHEYPKLLQNPRVPSHWSSYGNDIVCVEKSLNRFLDGSLIAELFYSALKVRDEFGVLFSGHLFDLMSELENREIRGGSRLSKKLTHIISSKYRILPGFLQESFTYVSNPKKWIKLPAVLCFGILLEESTNKLLIWIVLSLLECLLQGKSSRRYVIWNACLSVIRWGDLSKWPASATAVKHSLLLLKPTNPPKSLSVRVLNHLKQQNLYIPVKEEWNQNEAYRPYRPYAIPDWVADKHTLRGSGVDTRPYLIKYCSENNIDISGWDEGEFNKSHPLNTVVGGVEFFYKAGLVLNNPFPHCEDIYHQRSYDAWMAEVQKFGPKKGSHKFARERRYKGYLKTYGKRKSQTASRIEYMI